MLLRAARELNLDLARSAMFGDRVSDLQCAAAAGVPLRYLLGVNGTSRPTPPDAAGLSIAEFRNLQQAAASVKFHDAVSSLASAS